MCITTDGDAVKMLAWKFLLIVEIMTKHCRCYFRDTQYSQANHKNVAKILATILHVEHTLKIDHGYM